METELVSIEGIDVFVSTKVNEESGSYTVELTNLSQQARDEIISMVRSWVKENFTVNDTVLQKITIAEEAFVNKLGKEIKG